MSAEDFHWRETAEWKQRVAQVTRLREHGYTATQIAHLIEVSQPEVESIIEEEAMCLTLAKKNWENKVPLMEDIVSMGLWGIREMLKEMSVDPEVRRRMMPKVSDLKALTGVVTALNSMIRLETGQSTQNIAVKKSYAETKQEISGVAAMDPVFSYQLPEGQTGVEVQIEDKPAPEEVAAKHLQVVVSNVEGVIPESPPQLKIPDLKPEEIGEEVRTIEPEVLQPYEEKE